MNELDKIRAAGYIACLQWAISDDDVMRVFCADSGLRFTTFTDFRSRSPLDKMIDEATGMYAEYVKKFVPWFNEHIWGEEPPKGALK
jgi:hypothetical protein